MKNYLIAFSISAFAIVFVSCKKERTCSCTVATTGTVTMQSKSAGITFTLNLGLPIPIPIPPIVITSAKDTSFVTPYSYSNTLKTKYDKVSKGAIKKNCPSTMEETFTDGSTNIVPGSYTVTSTEEGKKTYTCKIE
jgi:hypothetical protein